MNNIEIEKVLDIVNSSIENVNINKDQLDDDLVAIGMDSITFIRIVTLLEETFKCEIPDEYLLLTEMNTANKIFNILKHIT